MYLLAAVDGWLFMTDGTLKLFSNRIFVNSSADACLRPVTENVKPMIKNTNINTRETTGNDRIKNTWSTFTAICQNMHFLQSQSNYLYFIFRIGQYCSISI